MRRATPLCPAGHLLHKVGDQKRLWFPASLTACQVETSVAGGKQCIQSISRPMGEMPGRPDGGILRRLLILTLIMLTALFPSPVLAGPSKADVEAQFDRWLQANLWPEAKKNGISEKTFRAAFSGVELNWTLTDLAPPGFPPPKEQKQTQAEFSSPGPYFNEDRLRRLAMTGRGFASQYASTLSRIEKIYGVPGSIVLAIWGRETGFGAAKIPSSAIEVLATKAFMSTRKDMFRMELIAALHILDGGDVTPADFKGSSAGALGQPQFMPTSYLKYAVDFDGDGHRNIWTSVPDTLASIANFLVKKGWQRGRDWGFEVTIPQAVSCAQEGPDLAKPLSHWASLGVDRISGKGFPSGELKAQGMMLVPAGRDGPQFIVTPNFYIIKEYNNSDLYALYIGNLADRIALGSGAFQGQWGDVGKMLRSDVAAMQHALERQGYDVGGTDGLPGYKTRRSIGQWQERNGMKPTCFPEESMKGKLK
ncbi:lytic murein transglycosylase [Rhizobium sp. BK418]|nr:lytic murein transglycosylase [Rhizobium sp. BK418]